MIAPEKIIYLDNNATTALDPAVLEEMLPFLGSYYGNPSGGYRFGKQVREAVDLARERVAALLDCLPGEIIFTSGGTESNNAALHSALRFEPKGKHIVTTTVEHSAILRPCEQFAARGAEVTFVGVASDGSLDLDELERAIRPETALVSVMWANNETGVVFPIDRIAEMVRAKRVLFHTDAIQAAGKIPIQLSEMPVNFCSFSAHKLHGPKGVGALYVDRRSRFLPSLFGGGQEDGRRSGTENVSGIIGFGKAAELALAKMDEEQKRVRGLRDRFENAILRAIPESFVNGGPLQRLPNTSSLSFAGIESDAALMLLDRQQICCSAGSACRTGSLESSHVMRAMGLSEKRLHGSLRFSFSRFNLDSEIDRVVEILPREIARLRALSAPGTLVSAGR